MFILTNFTKETKRCVLIASFILIFTCAYIIGYKYYINKMSILDQSHVYVCDNPKEKSKFDLWLTDTVGIDWVPSYIIIKNNYVIGAFNGCIEKDLFTLQFSTALALNINFVELPNYQITNLNGDRQYLTDIFNKKDTVYIVEIHLLTCKDCIYQDEHYTDDIYNEYTTTNIYRYYIKSEFNEVFDKYSKK